MDSRTYTARNRSKTSLLVAANLLAESTANGDSGHDKGQEIPKGDNLVKETSIDGQGDDAGIVADGNDDESNTYFFSEPSVSEDGDSQHIVRAPHRLGDGTGVSNRNSCGILSRQPPRHHRRGNVTSRDVRNFNPGSDDDYNHSMHLNSRRTAIAGVDDSQSLQQSTSQRNIMSNAFGDQMETSDVRQRVRQRFLNSTSLSPSNTSLSSWEPSSPDVRRKVSLQFVMPESKAAKYERLKQRGSKQSYLQQPTTHPHPNEYETYRDYQQELHESLDSKTATQEVQSTSRIVEYSQRQRIRQRSQQSFHNHSPSLGLSSINTGQWHTRSNRAHSLSAESVNATERNRAQIAVSNVPSSTIGKNKQSLEEYGLTPREKRSHSFDTSVSIIMSEPEAGDIVDYSQYPNRTIDCEEQNSADDEATSYTTMQGKETSKIGHCRSRSTSDTLALGRRRSNVIGAVAASNGFQLTSQSQQRVQQRGNSSMLHTTPSFGPEYDALSNGVKSADIVQKSIQESRDRLKRTEKVENIGSSSSDSVSDDENDHFRRRIRENSRIRRPSLRRIGMTMSPFANIGKSSAEKAARSTFLPTTYTADEKMYSTFICPRCKTRQREFFTVENAAGRLEGPGSYLALYFAVYVTCSLFIFGLEEGWKPLDCIYFAVITLTTAGLGDFVPTSWVNKIICSIFIYFGVACIGLLLGSYIASMLDQRANVDRKDKQVDACPNCLRIKTMSEAAIARNKAALDATVKYMTERVSTKPDQRYKSTGNINEQKVIVQTPSIDEGKNRKYHGGIWDSTLYGSTGSPAVSNSSTANSRLLGSPVTRQILGRQKHTRHASIDVSTSKFFNGGVPTTYGTSMVINVSDEMVSHRASTSLNRSGQKKASSTSKLRTITSSENLYEGTTTESEEESVAMSSSTLSSTEAIWDGKKSQLNAAKYVFVTLRLALFNSMVIIAAGCVGFWFIEGFTLIDSWYFTTVLLTTVGYGDIVPVTDAGKLFATIYILAAGTLLLNNMSSISMIPLELRRRRIERAVLTQFGDHLDDAALRELATGPLVQRLRLSANRTDGLDECTREMFSLAMLVRLGKVTEHDIRGTFSCFRHLDVNNEGVLNSKSIIAGMIAKQRQSNIYMTNMHQHQRPPPPPPPPTDVLDKEPLDQSLKSIWFGRQGSLHVATTENSYIFHELNSQNLSDGRINDEPLGLPLNDS